MRSDVHVSGSALITKYQHIHPWNHTNSHIQPPATLISQNITFCFDLLVILDMVILTTLVTHATHSQILSRTANRSQMYKRKSSAIHGPDLSKLYSAIARWLRSTERLIIGWKLVFSIAKIIPIKHINIKSNQCCPFNKKYHVFEVVYKYDW